MKTLLTGVIAAGSAAKIKSGTLKHLQDAYQEAIATSIINTIGTSYDASKYYILYGCENTGSGLNYIISAGAVMVNGIVFITLPKTFTATAGQVAIFQTLDTYVTGTNFDPVSFTDGSTHNIHLDRTGDWGSAVAASAANEFANMVRVNVAYTPTLTANYVTGSNLKVYKKNNQVFFDGIVLSNPSAAIGDTICTLPIEFRPTSDKFFCVFAAATAVRITIRVTTAGLVKIDTVYTGSWVSTNMYWSGQNYFI